MEKNTENPLSAQAHRDFLRLSGKEEFRDYKYKKQHAFWKGTSARSIRKSLLRLQILHESPGSSRDDLTLRYMRNTYLCRYGSDIRESGEKLGNSYGQTGNSGEILPLVSPGEPH